MFAVPRCSPYGGVRRTEAVRSGARQRVADSTRDRTWRSRMRCSGPNRAVGASRIIRDVVRWVLWRCCVRRRERTPIRFAFVARWKPTSGLALSSGPRRSAGAGVVQITGTAPSTSHQRCPSSDLVDRPLARRVSGLLPEPSCSPPAPNRDGDSRERRNSRELLNSIDLLEHGFPSEFDRGALAGSPSAPTSVVGGPGVSAATAARRHAFPWPVQLVSVQQRFLNRLGVWRCS